MKYEFERSQFNIAVANIKNSAKVLSKIGKSGQIDHLIPEQTDHQIPDEIDHLKKRFFC